LYFIKLLAIKFYLLLAGSKQNCIKSIVLSAEKKYNHDRTVATTSAACDASITKTFRLSALPSSVRPTPSSYRGFFPNSDAHNADQLKDNMYRLHTPDGMTSEKFPLSQHARNTLESVSSAFNTTVASPVGVTSRVKQPRFLRNQEKCPPKRVDDILFFDSIGPSTFENMSEVDKLLNGVDVGQALPPSATLDTFEWTALDNSGGLETLLRMPPLRDKPNTNDVSIPGFDFDFFLDAPLPVPEKQGISLANEIVQENKIREIEDDDDVADFFEKFDEQSFVPALSDSCDEFCL